MKILFINVSVALLFSAVIARGYTLDRSNDKISYMLECRFDELSNIYLVKFQISAAGLVKIKITDESKNVLFNLVEGEMEIGEYDVYFKSEETLSDRKLNCYMEVVSPGSNDLMYSNEIKIN